MTNDLFNCSLEEWQTELSGVRFTHAGLTCEMLRHYQFGYWLAHVNVPKDHPLSGVDYRNVDDIEVHGGLTLAGPLSQGGNWWFGFDCGHDGDMSPFNRTSHHDGGYYRNMNYTRFQTERLAEQLARYAEETDADQN